ncbi:thiol peroxidase [Coprobacter tertius]|uniref:Thiol peroxidase n=1 Tax=Coprobacter tertius TaxID=2944915 RepID=A0ABT1MEX8_9BACT|nr:thiol peroxidase [Coprobacter tertius]MCP9611190.1 thiol peroxidase [Coprobacter tertius]
MAQIKFKGSPVSTNGNLPKVGSKAPCFTLVKSDLSDLSCCDLKGKRIVLNIFPSLDTTVCATSVRKFNQLATQFDNTVVIAVSKDLPFAQSRFCTTEGIENVIPASAFRATNFVQQYGVEMIDGPLAGLLARAVVVIDEDFNIIYEELVPEITQEPNYQAVIDVLKK